MQLAARFTREAYRREKIPARLRWWLAAEGMRDWYRLVARGFELRPLDDRVAPGRADPNDKSARTLS